MDTFKIEEAVIKPMEVLKEKKIFDGNTTVQGKGKGKGKGKSS